MEVSGFGSKQEYSQIEEAKAYLQQIDINLGRLKKELNSLEPLEQYVDLVLQMKKEEALIFIDTQLSQLTKIAPKLLDEMDLLNKNCNLPELKNRFNAYKKFIEDLQQTRNEYEQKYRLALQIYVNSLPPS